MLPHLHRIFIVCVALLLMAPKGLTADVIHLQSFGLHVHGVGNGNPWPTVPFGFIRLWDSNTTWREIEPEKGVWRFEVLDRYVTLSEANGVKILLTLGQTPAWAAADPSSASPYAPGASSPPRNLDDWRDYVMKLAIRYKGRIRHWDVWNEINVRHFWSGDFATMVRMEQIATTVLKGVDPDNFVLTPSIQGGAYGMLAKYFKAGGGRYADGVSYHFYAPKDEPEAVAERITNVWKVMQRCGLGHKPLWNTEMGWLLANSDGSLGRRQRPAWRNWRKVGYNEAAGFVMRAYIVNMANGIENIFWYAWNNSAMGLAEKRGKIPKPAAEGYTHTVAWLKDAILLDMIEHQGVWQCHLQREGQVQYIVWSQKTRNYVVPDQWDVYHKTSIGGDTIVIDPQRNIFLGPEPVLLH